MSCTSTSTRLSSEQQAAAEVAERPAAGGDAVALVLGRDVDQDRVVADQRAAAEDAAQHDRDRAELPVVAVHEEQQGGEERRRPRRSRPCATSCGRTGRRRRRRPAARTRWRWSRSWSGRTAASRPRGAGRARRRCVLQVSSAESPQPAARPATVIMYGANRTREDRSCSTPSWPSRTSSRPSLLAARSSGLEARRRPAARQRSRPRPQSALARAPSLSTSVRSVIRPSTPRSRSRRISCGSSTVQTCTWTPGGVGTADQPGGGDRQAADAVGDLQCRRLRRASRRARRPGSTTYVATSVGDARGRDASARPAARKRRSRRRENDPTRTRSWRPRAATKAASGSTAASALRSMLKRASGKASTSSASVGIALAARPGRRPGSARSRSSRLPTAVGDPVEQRRRGRRPARRRWSGGRRSRGSGSPARSACVKAASVFSRPSRSGWRAPPRWANASTEPPVVEEREAAWSPRSPGRAIRGRGRSRSGRPAG